MANASRIVALVLLALAGLLGIYAFSLTRAAPAPRAVNATAVEPQIAVVVAAHDIVPGTALAAADLTMRMQAALPAGGFDAASALVGRVPTARIPAGMAVTEGSLASGFADAILPGERAIAIRVDESNAVGNMVKPGNAVDVFVVLKRDGAGGGADTEIASTHARLLLSKVRVLSFGDSTITASAAAPNAPDVANRAAARTAVLAVRVADIDALTLAESAGRLLLALRNPADPETPADATLAPLFASAKGQTGAARAAAGVSLAALSGASNATRTTNTLPTVAATPSFPLMPPLPAAMGASRQVAATGAIEVIRGGQSESVSY